MLRNSAVSALSARLSRYMGEIGGVESGNITVLSRMCEF